MECKKVVIIGSAYPLRGGLSNFNERLARAFVSDGYKTTIYTFSLQYPSIFFPGKSQFSTEPKPTDLDIRVVINSVNPINWAIWGYKIKKQKPDLVIIKFWIPFMAPCLGMLARIIRSNHTTKVITIIDNLIPHEKRLFDKYLAGFFARSVDGFLTMSRAVFQQVDLFRPGSPRIFSPHPVYDTYGDKIDKDKARKELLLKEEGNYILFFGFIRDYKGLDLLLEAMANSAIRERNINLLIAGEFYTDPQPFYRIIKKHDLSGQVILHSDFIPDSRVGLYFSAADLVVQPYKSATQSGVTQIAYHFEIPMIITDVGGLAEFVPDKKVGFIVEPDPDSIADGILRFFNFPDKSFFRDHLRDEKKKYRWEYFLDKIFELYSLINTK